MQRTRAALVEHARTLTARRGLAGFTVEELCEHVGVSRRTFFNYFASKEDAVLGNPPAALTPEDRDEFVAGGRPHRARLLAGPAARYRTARRCTVRTQRFHSGTTSTPL
ncbi:TetR/AcrR family transcriptional regulator [Rhodococcus sp. (in: high G+C Gram-positive bacteria)]|uniref:TetR/AcrR family transcriptional regulator n=1 Tax=Rhodococcus sp. TaxID=1831 RepID=UPI003EFC1EA3